MGVRGPVPKRSEERIRRNKDEVPVETVEMIGKVEIPELAIEDPHPMIVDFYESLKDSGQSKFYEPSDWEYARFTLHFANRLVRSSTPSAQMLASVNSMMTDLLVAEGARRRVRLEIEREQTKGQLIDVSARLREMLES